MSASTIPRLDSYLDRRSSPVALPLSILTWAPRGTVGPSVQTLPTTVPVERGNAGETYRRGVQLPLVVAPSFIGNESHLLFLGSPNDAFRRPKGRHNSLASLGNPALTTTPGPAPVEEGTEIHSTLLLASSAKSLIASVQLVRKVTKVTEERRMDAETGRGGCQLHLNSALVKQSLSSDVAEGYANPEEPSETTLLSRRERSHSISSSSDTYDEDDVDPLSGDAGHGDVSRDLIRLQLPRSLYYTGDEEAEGLQEIESGCAKDFCTALRRFLDDGTGDIQAILSERNQKEKALAMFLSAIRGNLQVLKAALEAGAAIGAHDSMGRTVLHRCSRLGRTQVVELLLEEGGASVDSLDEDTNSITPLCCAGAGGAVDVCRLLLRHGANINAGLDKGISPLKCAVAFRRVECVRFLLDSGALLICPAPWSETPVHIAASEGFEDCLELLLQHGGSRDDRRGKESMTPLHLAAFSRHHRCVRLLLESIARSNLEACDSKRRTALHLAASVQSVEGVKLLLEYRAQVDVRDVDLRTPLHLAVAKRAINLECVHALLDAGADPNVRDIQGFTPLHYAAANEFTQCIKLLLERGADVTIRNKSDVTPLMYIVRKTPCVLNKFKEMFDEGLLLRDNRCDREEILKMDFRTLLPHSVTTGRLPPFKSSPPMEKYSDPSGYKETLLFINFIKTGQTWLLMHPLCESFLHFKWLRVRKFFFFNIFFYSAFVLFLTLYTSKVFRMNCLMEPSSTTFNETSSDCDDFNTLEKRLVFYRSHDIVIRWSLLLVFTSVLFVKEGYQIAQSPKNYFTSYENWLQLSTALIAALLTHHENRWGNGYLPVWKFHLAGLSMILAWGELMLMIGRIPALGVYIQMFTLVLFDFVKFFATYACLILAFVFSFSILFQNRDPFRAPWGGLVSTLVMLTGEYEYNEVLFYNPDAPLSFPGTAHVIFLLFIFVVSIVMINLLIGLAVNDIQTLQNSARLERLVRQTELIAHMESTVFGKWLWFLPVRLRKRLHETALVFPRGQFRPRFRPNHPQEKRLPRQLLDAAYQLAKAKNQRNKATEPTKLEKLLTWEDVNQIKGLLNRHYGRCDAKEQKAMQAEVDSLMEKLDMTLKRIQQG
ncbi:unnamed protein product [Cyprideis torosa]|uniref:Ion transport domain-containing protein n=1 Tax=Cyprideis torosa TaxID=163714 RepID=A0A7R8ZI40_9CRUS|nr:unnamed protein product [Cyprideis torosa]CAG0885212.1 unnamed protein product [Cyprideis torosa]